ncbi:hypothetical protein KVT40_001635 [Elsinoe batatas]|uniref:Carboxylic ester hydrolase n=1 Tax=Elsinoe batatas TaxID=2601811 RepID=A0A8K0PHG5_9PEZI|nr:hypothetical protein KVT40_001635 [Elsinoe batatas]
MSNAVLDVCDGLDGVNDRLIEDPLACQFDVDSFACDAPNPSLDATTCLTQAQLNAAKAIYSGAKRLDNGEQVYPGFAFGSENAWALQQGPLSNMYTTAVLRNLVFKSTSYDSATFNFASDVDLTDRDAGVFIDHISPDLSAFHQSGGKLLVDQGWTDAFNAGQWPIDRLRQTEELFGCDAMIAWVEKGIRLEGIKSTEPGDGSNATRKLCPWPKTAKFVGANSDDWRSYECY